MARSELAGMAESELEDRLVESRRELFNLRFQRATGQLDNTARVGQVKRDVARILTVLRQRELGISEAGTLETAPARIPATAAEPEAQHDEDEDEEE